MLRPVLIVAAVAVLATAAHAQPAPGDNAETLDTDHDGKVSLAEFKAGNAQRQTRMFARMDANKDGKLSEAELQSGLQRRRAGGSGSGETPPVGRGGGLMMRLDADKDGAITRAEMASGAERRFEMADTNHDGWLSKGELIMMRQRQGGGPRPQ